LKDLFAQLGADVDFVNGFKIKRADSLSRRLIGRFYEGLVKVLFRLHIKDVDCDFRLMRRQVLEAVHLTFSSGAICAELMAQVERAGFRIAEVPVHHYPRASGESQFFRIGPVARTMVDLLRLWVRLIVLRRGPRTAASRGTPPTVQERPEVRVSK
jgi:hypothetical protein